VGEELCGRGGRGNFIGGGEGTVVQLWEVKTSLYTTGRERLNGESSEKEEIWGRHPARKNYNGS